MTRQTLADVFSGPRLASAAGALISASQIEQTTELAQADSVDATRSLLDKMLENAAVQLLDIPLADIMLGAWTRLAALQAYATGDKLRSKETHEFELSKHRIKSSHAPSIELLVHDKTVTTLVVNITLTMLVARTRLLIRQGRIMELQVSGCQVAGDIAYQGRTLFSKASAELEFPETISLGEGVGIPPPLGHKAH